MIKRSIYCICFFMFCMIFQQCSQENPTEEGLNPVFSCEEAMSTAEVNGTIWNMESVGICSITNSQTSSIPEGYRLQLFMKGEDGSAIAIEVLEFENGRASDCMDTEKTWSTEISNNYVVSNTLAEGVVCTYYDIDGNAFEVRATEGEDVEGLFSFTACNSEDGYISGTFSFVVEATAAQAGFVINNGIFDGICYE